MRHIQKQRTRENFLFGTAAWAAEVEIGGEETPKAEAASPENDVDSGDPTLETPEGLAWRTEEGGATATAPIAASASSSSLLSRIVRPRIRLPTITSTTP